MLTFYLFRAKVISPKQQLLFGDEKKPPEVLRSVLLSKPSKELRKGHVWHIGNVYELDEESIYFALGRTTTSIVERYDKVGQNFIEEDFETSPYTHAILDLRFQLLAIAGKSRLSPTARGIARQFERLANASPVIVNSKRKIEIAEIKDPETFISHIRNAYSVVFFSMDFGEPNPWDVNKDFQQPMQSLLQETSGVKGRTSISGVDLDRDILEELTRAAASAGNSAKAIVKSSKTAKGMTKHLRANPVTINEEELKEDSLQQILNRIREAYLKLRNLTFGEQ